MRSLEEDEIRLLVLDSGRYSLVYVPLDKAPIFYALSYAWVDDTIFSNLDPSQQTRISIDGREVALGDNLAAALEAWQGHKFRHIPLWVDFLCIDQDNIVERNHQVLRMHSIYKKAAVVTVWIGPESHESSLAWDFMPLFSQEAEDLDWVRRTICQHSFSREWKAVDHLLHRSWWKRVWIIQEMVAADEIIFVCGQQTVKSDVVLDFFEMLISLRGLYWALLLREEGIWLDGDPITLGATYLPQHASLKPLLLQTIYATGKSLASDDRDKIYAVLGLAQDLRQLVEAPDYSLPVEEVYKQFAISFVREYQSLEFLSLAGLPVYPRRPGLSLPSWIPDWNHRECGTINSTIRPTTTTNASWGLTSRVEISADCEKLTARGTCIDIIDGMGYSIWGASNGMPDFQVQQTFSRETRYTSVLEAISRTLLRNSRSYSTEESLYIFSQHCKESALAGNALATLAGGALFNEWYQHNRDFVIAGKSLREWVTQASESSDLKATEDETEVYVSQLSIYGRNRRLITTAHGYVGLGVNSCMPGDLVCVIFGCSTPILLRKVEDHYVVLGEAYLHGMMNGEAIEGLERGDFVQENFSIW